LIIICQCYAAEQEDILMTDTTIEAPAAVYFGLLPTGEVVWQYQLHNRNGVVATFINLGATLVSLSVPDKNGARTELTLGFDTIEEYLAHPFYFGCTVGRVANRIARGQFQLHHKRHQLTCNENPHSHLHGGAKGFDKVVWQAELVNVGGVAGIEFSYFSFTGEEHYPGNVLVKVTYVLTNMNELKIIYSGESDKATPLNLTNHTYWNLNGAGAGNILNHEIQLISEPYLLTDTHHIPTGEIKSVLGTDYDFRTPALLDERMGRIGGYDDFYILDNDKNLRLAARAHSRDAQRALEVYTTEAGIQFYTGNYLTDYHISNVKKTSRWGGFCFETQGFPDAVNHAYFPQVILEPGETYQQETIYRLFYRV
jgi:aldose 1-epimerase